MEFALRSEEIRSLQSARVGGRWKPQTCATTSQTIRWGLETLELIAMFMWSGRLE